MSYPICEVKNIDTATETYCGIELAQNDVYTIPDTTRIEWASNDKVLTAIVLEKIKIGNGSEFYNTINEQIERLKNYY